MEEAMKAVSEEETESPQVNAVWEVKKAKKVEQAINPEKFSSWRKLIPVTARLQRLAKNIRLSSVFPTILQDRLRLFWAL